VVSLIFQLGGFLPVWGIGCEWVFDVVFLGERSVCEQFINCREPLFLEQWKDKICLGC